MITLIEYYLTHIIYIASTPFWKYSTHSYFTLPYTFQIILAMSYILQPAFSQDQESFAV